MRCFATVLFALLALIVAAATPALAGTILPGTYWLLDHGDGDLGPDYGLRMDQLSVAGSKTFSVEAGGAAVSLTWAGGATANISGTLLRNGTSELWTVDYDLTGVAAVGTQGFTATGGSGTLTDPSNNDTALTGLQNGSGYAFEFLADGWRIDGDSDSEVGRGWLQGYGTNDWLVRAIPEPGTLWIFGAGLLALTLYRRA
jgi:hypothetical protein